MTRFFLWFLAVCPVFLWALKPNILFIISDDQSPRSIGGVNIPEIKTPNLDRLAKQGTLFSHCFNQGSWSGAVCVASRTMLITGQTFSVLPRTNPIWTSGPIPGSPRSRGLDRGQALARSLPRGRVRHFPHRQMAQQSSLGFEGFQPSKGIAKGMYETFDPSGSKKPGYDRPRPATTTGLPGIGNSPAIGLLSFGTS